MGSIFQYIKDNPVLVANIIAFVAVAITFASYQVNSQKKILTILCIAAVVSAASFVVLRAWTGVAMNCIVLVRNIVYYNKDVKLFKSKLIPIFFAAVTLAFGIFTWEAWFCALSVIGLLIDTLALYSNSAQFIRKSILITAPLFLVYDILEMNYLEAVKEVLSVISVLIGIFRYRKIEKT